MSSASLALLALSALLFVSRLGKNWKAVQDSMAAVSLTVEVESA